MLSSSSIICNRPRKVHGLLSPFSVFIIKYFDGLHTSIHKCVYTVTRPQFAGGIHCILHSLINLRAKSDWFLLECQESTSACRNNDFPLGSLGQLPKTRLAFQRKLIGYDGTCFVLPSLSEKTQTREFSDNFLQNIVYFPFSEEEGQTCQKWSGRREIWEITDQLTNLFQQQISKLYETCNYMDHVRPSSILAC